MEIEKIKIVNELQPIPKRFISFSGRPLALRTIEQLKQMTKTFNNWNQNQTITLDRLKSFLEEEKESKASNTVKREKSLLKSILPFTFPELNNRIASKRLDAELSEIRLPKTNSDKTQYALSEEKILEALDGFTNNKHKLIIRFLYQSASRVSECLAIKLKDCFVERDETKIRIVGKGNKEGFLRLSTKLFNEIRNEFQGNQYLFERNGKKKTYSRQNIFLIVSKFEQIIGVPFSPHKLRHSRATNLIQEGVAVSQVSKFLRHSTTKTTVEFYDHSILETKTLLRTAV
jgi:site-specific recombinase XerD